jgi:hypothetical protein
MNGNTPVINKDEVKDTEFASGRDSNLCGK